MNIFQPFKQGAHYFSENYLKPRQITRKNSAVLKKNLDLKDSRKGERCFILGGGPSLKDIDFDRFKNEQTFVVNEFDKNEQYDKISPDNYLIVDTAYFTEPEDHFHTQSFLAKPSVVPKEANVFLNVKAQDFVKERGLFTDHNVYYVAMHGLYSDIIDFQIDIDKTVPWPKNSVLMCIVIAVYMGFEKIYLLGCEHNFLSQNIGLGKDLTYNHSYKDGRENVDSSDPEVAKKYTTTRDLNLTYEKQIANIKQLFKNYRMLKNKAAKLHPNTQIFNATPDSFLDVFPFIELDDVLE